MIPMKPVTASNSTQMSNMPGEISACGLPWQNTNDFPVWLAAARPRLFRLARMRGIAPDAIEDVVQETLLEAWKHQERLYDPGGFSAWLDEICRNICRRSLRKQTIDRRYVVRSSGGKDDLDVMLQEIPDAQLPDPLEEFCRQDRTSLLDRALGVLSGNAREVVELCYLQETPQREAAERLGVSLSALEARLHRARQQLRQALNGALHEDAEALGLALDQESVEGWRETRLWCTLCGQRRLMGMFLPQPGGGINLHMRCPDCERRYGLSDVHNSNVHSRGLIPLVGLHAFRPAWKRTMRGVTQRFGHALSAGEQPCPYCGSPASLQLVENAHTGEAHLSAHDVILPIELSTHPYRFWVWWRCPQCHGRSSAGVFAASDLVYWSHEQSRHYMSDYPRWTSEPELLVEYAGRPAIRFQMANRDNAARLTVLADRQTLQILAVI